jgi:hypothetical protein
VEGLAGCASDNSGNRGPDSAGASSRYFCNFSEVGPVISPVASKNRRFSFALGISAAWIISMIRADSALSSSVCWDILPFHQLTPMLPNAAIVAPAIAITKGFHQRERAASAASRVCSRSLRASSWRRRSTSVCHRSLSNATDADPAFSLTMARSPAVGSPASYRGRPGAIVANRELHGHCRDRASAIAQGLAARYGISVIARLSFYRRRAKGAKPRCMFHPKQRKHGRQTRNPLWSISRQQIISLYERVCCN